MAEPKKVNVVLIEESSKWYKEMRKLIKENHPHLTDAKIALFWQHGWAEDADGKLVLGRASKANDLNRALHEHDFAIELNHEVFNSSNWTIEQARALIDHELTHCEVKRDSDGAIVTDEQGRTVYRIRKHDIEEFRDVVARHGLYKGDLEKFAESIREDERRPLLKTVMA